VILVYSSPFWFLSPFLCMGLNNEYLNLSGWRPDCNEQLPISRAQHFYDFSANFIIACTALYNNRYAKKQLVLFAYIFPHRLAITWNNSRLKFHQYATFHFAIIALTHLLRRFPYHGAQCFHTLISGAPGKSHGLVRSRKRRNLVSACAPSELNCTLPPDLTEKSLRFC
jgi:hypothetical protein